VNWIYLVRNVWISGDLLWIH